MLGLLHDSLYLSDCVSQLRTGLNKIEKDFDLTIELEGYTKADIPDLKLDGITILYGVVPNIPTGSTRQQVKKTMTHRQKDDQLKLMSRKLVDLIQQEASIVRRAKDHIDRLLKEDRAMEHFLHFWLMICHALSAGRTIRWVVDGASGRVEFLNGTLPESKIEVIRIICPIRKQETASLCAVAKIVYVGVQQAPSTSSPSAAAGSVWLRKDSVVKLKSCQAMTSF